MGSGQAINAAGTIVGYAFDAASALRAFVYTGGAMYDLNTLVSPTDSLYGAITLIDAEGINDGTRELAGGQIYIGQFSDNFPPGRGVLRSPDGSIYAGQIGRAHV